MVSSRMYSKGITSVGRESARRSIWPDPPHVANPMETSWVTTITERERERDTYIIVQKYTNDCLYNNTVSRLLNR